MDWLDSPALAYKLVCDGADPLTNEFVRARKEHECDICADTIAAGLRVRRETRRSADGASIETRYVCPTCSELAHDYLKDAAVTHVASLIHLDSRQAIDARHALGRERRCEP